MRSHLFPAVVVGLILQLGMAGAQSGPNTDSAGMEMPR